MAEEKKPLGGTGTEYPRSNEILSILGSNNLDLKLAEISENAKEAGDKKAQALSDAIQGITGNFTLREVLFCPDYNCVNDYFTKLNGILNVQKRFFEYKKIEDAKKYFAGKPWDAFSKTYDI